MYYSKLKVYIFFLLSIVSFITGSSLSASSCKKEINAEIELLESYDDGYITSLKDIDEDGRKEILISHWANGPRSAPDMKLTRFLGNDCSKETHWLSNWYSIWGNGWYDVQFVNAGKDVLMTAYNSPMGTDLKDEFVTYKFKTVDMGNIGESVEYVSFELVEIPETILDITATEASQKDVGYQTIEKKFDLNGDATLETISCEYWGNKHQIYGFRLGCEIFDDTQNLLNNQEPFQTKRAGILPKKYNGWHIISDNYYGLLVYEAEIGYINTNSLFDDFYATDFFGDDLTPSGYKGVTVQECQLICLQNEDCAAYSYIESKKWCFPKHGTGKKRANANILSGIKTKISN
jgi:hypothetical protein